MDITHKVEELVDLILFGDIHESGWNNLEGIVNEDFISGLSDDMDKEQEIRIAIASTIMEKFRGYEVTLKKKRK